MLNTCHYSIMTHSHYHTIYFSYVQVWVVCHLIADVIARCKKIATARSSGDTPLHKVCRTGKYVRKKLMQTLGPEHGLTILTMQDYLKPQLCVAGERIQYVHHHLVRKASQTASCHK